MEQMQNRKRDMYSHKQSVKEEAMAPVYLESAGDVLVKKLARKQLNTHTTLEDQLNLTQNFDKGFDLSPDLRRGVTTLEELQKQMKAEDNEKEPPSKACDILEKTQDLREMLKETGLSRHEVEIMLCEKPNSDISKLYAFALVNKKQEKKTESADRLLPNHPIHHLTKIHDEYFGHLNRSEKKVKTTNRTEKITNKKNEVTGEQLKRKKKKHRKRHKKCSSIHRTCESEPSTSKTVKPEEMPNVHAENEKRDKVVRPSLWDVKDMKKWCEPKKEYSCKPQTFYTIKENKIIKLDDFYKNET